jgi:hypothetical protein
MHAAAIVASTIQLCRKSYSPRTDSSSSRSRTWSATTSTVAIFASAIEQVGMAARKNRLMAALIAPR